MRNYARLAIAGFFLAGCAASRPATTDYRLNDIWLLTSINGQVIERSQFSGNQPYVEIHLSDNRVLGFAGCRHFSGTFAMEKRRLRISPAMDTLASCPAIKLEEQFTRLLSEQAFDYQIGNLQLILKNKMNQLTFKKVD